MLQKTLRIFVPQTVSLRTNTAKTNSLCYNTFSSTDAVDFQNDPAQTNSLCYNSLSSIMQSLKGYTARKANQILGRSGAFWQHESYDHCVRNPNELKRIITYVLNNPVKIGLVDEWKKWQWSYYRQDLLPERELLVCVIMMHKLKVCATTDFSIYSQGSGTRTLPYQGLLSRDENLCRDSILKILEDGKYPDWNDLILG